MCSLFFFLFALNKADYLTIALSRFSYRTRKLQIRNIPPHLQWEVSVLFVSYKWICPVRCKDWPDTDHFHFVEPEMILLLKLQKVQVFTGKCRNNLRINKRSDNR